MAKKGSMRKRTYRLIIGGMIFIVFLSLAVFVGMNRYMGKETKRDVQQIAKTYLDGISHEEVYHYNTIAEIRVNQISYMIDDVQLEMARLGEENAETAARFIADAAAFQNLRTCALISGKGTIETVYGPVLETLSDPEFLMESIAEDRSVATSGFNSNEELIIWAAPASFPMENGETSVAVLCCRRLTKFIDRLHLDADGTLAYFHVLWMNGEYLVENADTYEDTFFARLKNYSTPEKGTIDDVIAELQGAMQRQEDYWFAVTFNNPETGVKERRNLYAMPLPNSNWYMVAVMPYGVLNSTIEDMGVSRSYAMLLCVAILECGILIVFGMYFRLSQNQLNELEEARRKAEESMIEAETASEEAVEARQRAEDSLAEAEAAGDEAVRSRAEAEKAREEAEKAREDAERAREEAEYANRAKSEFLSNMSHDIRTPMNAIVGMTAIAQSHIDNRAQVEDCLQKINLSGKQLLGLINDVLDMSKIESGKLTLNMDPLSLKETMEVICDIIRPQLHDKKQNFDIFIREILCEDVYCDSVRINQVMLNFLSNAMKFTPEGGNISVTLNQEDSPKGKEYVRTHFYVSDTGIGMSPEFQTKIFNAFEREDNKRVHKIQGTGLGMAITKYIVDAMGGSIELESALGKGTTFHVTLDLKRVPEKEQEMKLPPWRILVVDDNEALCESARITLEELGTRPDTARSGEEAIETGEKAHDSGDNYYVILIDYLMEGMNGIETTREIRKLVGGEIPISIISAYDWIEIEDEARAAGVNDFIPKPLFRSTIYRRLYPYTEEGSRAPVTETAPEKYIEELSGLRILLAEDQYVNAVVATTLLQEEGAEVDLAEDGAIAVEKFKESEPGYYDLILMDLRMPNKNGLEASREIREMDRPDAGKIPIIAMTADAFSEDVKKCMDAGMNAHLSKPIDMELLRRTISRYV